MGGVPKAVQGTESTRVISAEEFSFACFRFTLRLGSDCRLPEYKGDVFHRTLGRGLSRVSPRFGEYFFKPQKPANWPHPSQTPPKPFMLIPPLETRHDYRAGEELELGLVLYGEALQYLMIAFAAFEAAGAKKAPDGGLAQFAVEKVEQLQGGDPRPLFRDNQWLAPVEPITAYDVFTNTPRQASAVTLHTLTRIRLKNGNRLVRETPPLAVFISRLLGSVNTLSAMYCRGMILTPEEKTTLTTLAASSNVKASDMRWRDWRRKGNGPDNTMQFGGLLGSVTYADVPGMLLPWLNLGQWIGIGGKTSFGLGLYALSTEGEVLC